MTQRVEWPAPNGGIDEISSPGEMKRDRARQLQNWLVHRPGRLLLRGPFGVSDTPTTGALFGTLTGVVAAGDSILVQGGGTQTYTAEVDASGVPTTTLRTADTEFFDGRGVNVDGSYYGPSTTSTDKLLVWDGTASSPAVLGEGPNGATDVASHLARLFAAGGSVPGTTTPAKPNAVYWTILGGPTTGTLADWEDADSGLVNQLTVGSPGDPIVALLSLGRQLIVLKQYSIWTILGDTPSSFVVRQISNRIGCADKCSAISVDDYCVFVAPDGVYAFDPSSGLQPLSQHAIDWSALDLPGTGQRISAARLPNNYVAIAGYSSEYLMLCHLPTLSWTRVTGRLPGTVQMICNDEIGNAYVVGYNATNTPAVTHMNWITDPAAAVRDGKSWPMEEAPGLSQGPVAIWRTWVADIGNFSSKAALRKMLLTYKAQAATSGSVNVVLSPFDEASDTTLFMTPDVTIADPVAFPERQYYGVEYFAEASAFSIKMTWTWFAGDPGMTSCEVYGLAVDYEPGQSLI